MKSFACGDVVPGCRSTFTAQDDETVLAQAAAHARAEHGLTEITPALVEQVRGRITVAA